MNMAQPGTFELAEQVLEREGCPLHYWVGGPQDRPLVVLTHGACVDHHSFDPIIPRIAQQYRVLAWDVRGHGQSQPMGRPLTIPLAVEDLLAILDRLGCSTAFLVGHSNGSYIAQELVWRHPERVSGLVIADGTCITWQRPAYENALVRVSGDLMNLFPYETLKRTSLPYISDNKAVQDYTYAAYSQLSKANFITLWKGISACLHAEPGYTIPRPFLLVHGDHDRMGDILKIAPTWAAREPNCEYTVIANAGHFAILDQPEKFAELVLDFAGRRVG